MANKKDTIRALQVQALGNYPLITDHDMAEINIAAKRTLKACS